MMTRILKHKPEELLAEGKKLLKSGEDSKFAYRVTMVNLLLEDSEMTTVRLSELSGVSIRTLNNWVKKRTNWALRLCVEEKRREKLLD